MPRVFESKCGCLAVYHSWLTLIARRFETMARSAALRFSSFMPRYSGALVTHHLTCPRLAVSLLKLDSIGHNHSETIWRNHSEIIVVSLTKEKWARASAPWMHWLCRQFPTSNESG